MDKIPTQFIYNSDDKRKTENSVGFYSRIGDINHSNVSVGDRPLVVNCVGRVDIPYSFKTSEPRGRHDYYLMYLTSGKLSALVNGKTTELVPGDTAIYLPEREYRYAKLGSEAVQYLWVHFTGSGAGKMLEHYGFSGGVYKIGIDENISMQFMLMMEDFIIRDSYFEESAANRLASVLIAMRRRLNSLMSSDSGSYGRIYESIKYIHDNFNKFLPNEMLAGIEHLSVSQYIELFKKCTGTTPRCYIIELRMRNSCDLLHRSDLTIAQIAQAVGYDDPHYFSRIFKTYRKLSPEQYRETKL